MSFITVLSLLFGGGIIAKDTVETSIHIAEPNRQKAIKDNNPIYFDGKHHRYIPTGEICYGRLKSVRSNLYPHLSEDRFIYEVIKKWQAPKIVWTTESPIEKDEQIKRNKALSNGRDGYYNGKARMIRFFNDSNYYEYIGGRLLRVYSNEGQSVTIKTMTEEEKNRILTIIRE